MLIISISVFFFYEGTTYPPLNELILSLSYAGTFLSGIFYAYGFTAAPATATLLILAKEQNIIIASLLGGLGALISDIFIFLFIQYSFSDEISRFKREKIVRTIEKEEKKIFGHYQKYLLATFAGFLIASPLPSEIGVSLMASLKNISIKKFIIIAYILHTVGIGIILIVGKMVL